MLLLNLFLCCSARWPQSEVSAAEGTSGLWQPCILVQWPGLEARAISNWEKDQKEPEGSIGKDNEALALNWQKLLFGYFQMCLQFVFLILYIGYSDKKNLEKQI